MVPFGHPLGKWCLFWQKGHYFMALGQKNEVVHFCSLWDVCALSEGGTKTVPLKVPFYG